MTPPFPFTAVIGQSEFKKALVLNAINPMVGGVLISGPRGCAKSTLARALGQLLPAPEVQLLPASETQLLAMPENELVSGNDAFSKLSSSFVTLPLGASEEMLLGTLDLQQVLNEKKVQFQEGLLAKAHDGVLYVDEVNLLNDSLVDLLLDVAASGVNVVERDGISHRHDSRFILLGTMNPDEGELRPQLQDRFGLMVKLNNQFTIEERMGIVEIREAYERHPARFCEQHQDAQLTLVNTIQAARDLLPQVLCSTDMRRSIAQQCVDAQVEGLRADLVWYRAALSHAAFCGHKEVQASDIDAVKDLVLAHRQNSLDDNQNGPSSTPPDDHQDNDANNHGNQNNGSTPPTPPWQQQGNGTGQQSPFNRPQDSFNEQAPAPESAQNGTNSSDGSSHGQWGSMAPEFQSLSETKAQSFQLMKGAHKQPVINGSLATLMNMSAQQKGLGAKGLHASSLLSNKPNWFKTLLHNGSLHKGSSLIFNKQKSATARLNFILLDTSASTLANKSFSQAKQIILNLAQQAYLKREKIAIMGFGNAQVKNLLASVRAPKHIRAFLEGIPAGGGTPFNDAILAGQEYLQNLKRKIPALQVCSYILSDGRISQNALQTQANLGESCVFIDTESSSVKRGRGQAIAQKMGADYFALN